MHEGADGSGREVRDKLGLPGDNEKRRKYFLDAKNRQSFVFEKGRLYSGVRCARCMCSDMPHTHRIILGLLQWLPGFW